MNSPEVGFPIGQWFMCTRSLEGLARLSASQWPERAVRLAAAAHALCASLGARDRVPERQRLNSSLKIALDALGAAEFAVAWNVGLYADVAQLLTELAEAHLPVSPPAGSVGSAAAQAGSAARP
jgi:hypothetical protein